MQRCAKPKLTSLHTDSSSSGFLSLPRPQMGVGLRGRWVIQFFLALLIGPVCFSQAQQELALDLNDSRNAAQQLEALSEQLDMQALRDFFEYDPRGRRDPFTIPEVDKPVDQLPSHGPLLPLQKYDLSALKLIGIIWDVNQPRAMIQESESKRIHTVGVNAKIGIRNGYIAVIREGEVVVVETIEQDGRLISTAQIMKLVQ